jgi:pimeloyl-ACP methyl ester carboxylesterase
LTEPLARRYAVPVTGGRLRVARTEQAPDDADVVALAIHGITSSHMLWRPAVRSLTEQVCACVLAPDLRGRGDSAELAGPYGFHVHVRDLVALLDDAEVERVVVVGHAMGAYIAAAIATSHPDRVSGVVLVDGGVAVPSSFGDDADELIPAMLDAAMDHVRGPYASADDYVATWRRHPAFADDWNDDVEAYVRHEVRGHNGDLRIAVAEPAIRADITDLVHDRVARTAVDRVESPISLLTAPRGVLNDVALLPRMLVETFAWAHPRATVEQVPNVNHYTMLLGGGDGPARVAAAILRTHGEAGA